VKNLLAALKCKAASSIFLSISNQRRGRESGVTGCVVEKALKAALGFSPKGDARPIGCLPRQVGKAKRVFYKKAAKE